MKARRILLADDDPQLVQLMGRYLERFDYEIVVAGSTAAAWRAVEEGPAFVVAIVDVTLDAPNGQELARKLLAASEGTTVILTSGYAADVHALETEFPRPRELSAKAVHGRDAG